MDRLRMAETQPRLHASRSATPRAQRGATAWVVVLVLPVLIVMLFVTLEALGLIARVV